MGRKIKDLDAYNRRKEAAKKRLDKLAVPGTDEKEEED
jgi:hypothetical protein